MRKVIQILIILFLISGCGRLVKNDKTTEIGIVKNKSEEHFENKFFLCDHSIDTIKTDTFPLKNNYKLIVFPSRNEESDSQINFNFLGKDVDTIIMSDAISTKKNTIYFDNSDFTNFFAIKQNGGTNVNFFLFDKDKRIQCLNGLQVKFDFINELIIYKDDKYNLFLFNCKSKKSIPINIPYNKLKKYDCLKYGNIESEITIKKVSDDFYYFGFNLCDSVVSFRVRK